MRVFAGGWGAWKRVVVVWESGDDARVAAGGNAWHRQPLVGASVELTRMLFAKRSSSFSPLFQEDARLLASMLATGRAVRLCCVDRSWVVFVFWRREVDGCEEEVGRPGAPSSCKCGEESKKWSELLRWFDGGGLSQSGTGAGPAGRPGRGAEGRVYLFVLRQGPRRMAASSRGGRQTGQRRAGGE
jgi:hypothetical protein